MLNAANAVSAPARFFSKQTHLVALRRAEEVGAQRELGVAQAIALGGDLEAGPQQFRPRALPPHPAEEGGIVVAAAAKRADRRHHLAGAVGIMLVEPRTE